MNTWRFYFLLMLTPMLCHAGNWVRNSPSSTSFSGTIEKDELSRFLKIYSITDRTLVLDSGGGNTVAAIDIAETLVKNEGLTIIVQGMCASSCANYLFLAGHKKVIDHGIVGFHGNLKAWFSTEKYKNEFLTLDPKLQSQALDYKMTAVQKEARFLREISVDQELFERTQRENDEGLYDIYLPNAQMFEAYGIHGVIGTQDLSILKSWPDVKVLFENELIQER